MPARIRLRRRFNPLAAILPGLRWLSTTGLLVALVAGGIRWFTRPLTVGALEFTRHIVGIETGAVGVQGVATSDIEGDGDQDILTAGLDGVKVYINNGSESFEQKVIDDKKSERIQVIDLDGDGDRDLLVTHKGISPSVRWYRNNGNVEFTGFAIGTGDDARAYAGDIDADGSPDIVAATKEGGEIVLRRWMNNGSGTFSSTTLATNAKVTALTVGDVNGNGYRDIVTGGEDGLQRWDTSDGVTWSRVDIDEGNDSKTHIVLADVNKQGRTDIVTADQAADVVAYYRNQDNSTFQRVALAGTTDATIVVVVDLDEDGDEDIIASGQDDNSVYWFDNDGSDNFTRRTIATNLQSVFGVAVGDIDGDNDFDFVAGDHFRGTVYWYERTRAKPVATAPSNIQQTTDGAGRITFDTTLSDGDSDPTRIRIQYSTDGQHWYKPWLIKATPASGSVDLKNSNGYQVGTSNPIDTDSNSSVKLTLIWDTKSTENTGGPIVGDVSAVQLRVIPRDDVSIGAAAVSSTFRVDNQAPQGVGGLVVTSLDSTQATLAWDQPTDSSAFVYKLYYDADHASVLERRSDAWDGDDDPAMNDLETTSATVTGLETGTAYTFKLFVEDSYGNTAAAPSVRATPAAAVATPTPTPTPPGFTPTPTPSPGVSPTPSPGFSPSPSPTPSPLPTLTPTPTPEVNQPPQADAGPDQAVNQSALVILDGTASTDPDQDSLVFSWRQLSGPEADLISSRTATPSFSAGGENETYIFALTVRDSRGASATDTVTVATRQLPESQTTPVEIGKPTESPPPTEEAAEQPALARNFLRPLDLLLFFLSAVATGVSLAERGARAIRNRARATAGIEAGGAPTPRGRVVHYRTGEPVVGAQVMIFDATGKLRSTQRTNEKGEFGTLFPAGQYTISVQAEGFTFAPTASVAPPESGILYTGGTITVKDPRRPLSVLIPLKPIGKEVSSSRTRFLHFWQSMQRLGRAFSWPIFLVGVLLNTVLVFWTPSSLYLVLEVAYVLLVIIKIALEVRVRPAYGLVRDAITHVPLDLAVVRLYEQGTNRLIMTRVTNMQGRFFALPPAGKYTITVTKPGYAVFSKQDVDITSEQDSALQITAELMPVAPAGGLQAARAAVL